MSQLAKWCKSEKNGKSHRNQSVASLTMEKDIFHTSNNIYSIKNKYISFLCIEHRFTVQKEVLQDINVHARKQTPYEAAPKPHCSLVHSGDGESRVWESPSGRQHSQNLWEFSAPEVP